MTHPPFDNILSLEKKGKLFLFKISNKDFSKKSYGKPNLHTIYWKMLFDEENIKEKVYKLNGEAAIFHRKQSLYLGKTLKQQKPTHKAGEVLQNKNLLNKNKTRQIEHELYKDKRFREDKYFLHVSITQNFKNRNLTNINEKAQEYIKHTNDLHIIGIDLGERHLAYYTVIDMQGNIVEQKTLNIIESECGNNIYKTDYHQLLVDRKKKIKENQQNWKVSESIKELKDGFLSQAIHEIVKLMIKYNAVVVLENLNPGFKQTRQKNLAQVYQRFETALVEKLRFVVDKNLSVKDVGGAMKALQLVSAKPKKKSESKSVCEQNGFLLYIPAWNTSKIDPVTGFVNRFRSYDLKYSSLDRVRKFFEKFKSIGYNSSMDLFEFEFDYKDFGKDTEGALSRWKVCSYGERVRKSFDHDNKARRISERIDITERIKELMLKFGIELDNNLKESILAQNKEFFAGNPYKKGQKGFLGFCDLFGLLLQMRNSYNDLEAEAMSDEEKDFIISPVAYWKKDKEIFFDSRSKIAWLPYNADANGAYNIARKGLMAVRQIKEASDLSKLKFDISNKAWLTFAQTKPYLND